MQVQANKKWMEVSGKYFDAYDFSAMLFGWIVAMQGKTDSTSDCFYASYAVIEQLKFWMDEIVSIGITWNVFNPFMYTPIHIFNNANAAYEYCNFYMYIVQL